LARGKVLKFIREIKKEFGRTLVLKLIFLKKMAKKKAKKAGKKRR